MQWIAAVGAGTLVVLIALAAADSAVGPIRQLDERTRHVTSRPRLAVRRGHPLGVAIVSIGGVLLVGVFATAVVLLVRFTWQRPAPTVAAHRRRMQIERDMPDALDLFVLVVHSGVTPRQAIGQLAERAPPSVRVGFAAVIARLDRGEPLADSLRAIDDELGPVAFALSDVLGAADRYGLPLEPVLQQLAAESRAARRRLDEAEARALPVKLSFPLVVCTLPSFVLLAIIPAVLAALSSLGGNAW